MDDLTNVKTGLELDKMDFTNFIREKPPVSTKKQSKEKPPNQIRKLFQKVTDVSRLMIMLLFTCMALLLVGIYFLWGQTTIDPSALSYVAVGPVMTTIRSGQPVKIKVKLEFKDPSRRDRIAGMESLIKDKMLMILASLDEKDILGEQGYKTLKDRIKSFADSLMKDNVIENIYFSEIQIFDGRTEPKQSLQALPSLKRNPQEGT